MWRPEVGLKVKMLKMKRWPINNIKIGKWEQNNSSNISKQSVNKMYWGGGDPSLWSIKNAFEKADSGRHSDNRSNWPFTETYCTLETMVQVNLHWADEILKWPRWPLLCSQVVGGRKKRERSPRFVPVCWRGGTGPGDSSHWQQISALQRQSRRCKINFDVRFHTEQPLDISSLHQMAP